ncbi:MAG TPA: hypothetical protein VIG33_16500 [Pseudobdellovibrionaceae bacterium]
MKRSLMLLASILLCTGLAKATENGQAKPGLDDSILGAITLAQPTAGGRLMTPAEEKTTDDQMKTQAYCYAWTTCPDGRRISCNSSGESCRWSYRTGRMVYCSGTGNGRTRWVRYTCY